jgi:hypothetical protein
LKSGKLCMRIPVLVGRGNLVKPALYILPIAVAGLSDLAQTPIYFTD